MKTAPLSPAEIHDLGLAADYHDVSCPDDLPLETWLGELDEEARRKVIGLARWFGLVRQRERDRCSMIAASSGAFGIASRIWDEP
jgi:hypothetical protein